jgi:hypothetical protein
MRIGDHIPTGTLLWMPGREETIVTTMADHWVDSGEDLLSVAIGIPALVQNPINIITVSLAEYKVYDPEWNAPKKPKPKDPRVGFFPFKLEIKL